MRRLVVAVSMVVLGACGGTVEVHGPLPNGPGGSSGSLALPSYASLAIIEEYSESGSYFTVELSNAGPLDGVHGAWCVDPDTFSSWEPYAVKLYSSYATLPPGAVEAPANLDLVNYLINNFEAGDMVDLDWGDDTTLSTSVYTTDIQEAIWGLVSPSYYVGDGTVGQALIEVARAEGEGFLPACDEQLAVIAMPAVNQDPATGNDVQVLAPVVPVSPEGCP